MGPAQALCEAVTLVDQDAARIGDLYRCGKSCMVDSVRYLLEAGSALIIKQDAIEHGQWIPWLKENAKILGFESRFTAAKLMKAARKHSKCAFDGTLDEAQALEISRDTWGNNYSDDGIIAAAKEILSERINAKRAAKKAEYQTRIEATQPKPLEGKYRIIYADPPWLYVGHNQVGRLADTPQDHYPVMSDQELCDYRPGDGRRTVKELADANAVLFMWVTAPMLQRAFPIIEAWGFEYKQLFVWNKVKPNMGYYNRANVELLLICTRGSCTPDTSKRIDSVQSIERSDKHSEKPQEFYDIIDGMYDHGRKLELFSRGTAPEGWDTDGNESSQTRSVAA
jgi:N6-adenosine-specific RNA methylase IME4